MLKIIDPVVSIDWLKNNLEDNNIILLNASVKDNINNFKSKYSNLQIKNARFFDLKNIFCDKTNCLPNTIPKVDLFTQECQKLGINFDSKLIIYDNLGIYTSPRAWWLFKLMGHENVAILDGGLPAWIEEGLPTEAIKKQSHKIGDFEVIYQPELVKNANDIQANLISKKTIVIDARSADRYNGTTPEPREGMKSGHIPNSVNLPFSQVLENGKFKSKEELVKLFNKLDIENKPLIFTCGSGITACIVLMASELISKNKKSVYDGSWSEWGSLKNVPIEK